MLFLSRLNALVIDIDGLRSDYIDRIDELKKIPVLFFGTNHELLKKIVKLSLNFKYTTEQPNAYFYGDFVKEIKNKLGVPLTEVAVVSNSQENTKIFQTINITTIGISKEYIKNSIVIHNRQKDLSFEFVSQIPDCVVYSFDDLLKTIHQEQFGYFAECVATNINVPRNTFVNVLAVSQKCHEFPLTYVIGGRYFAKKDDRHQFHPLTNRILKEKDHNYQQRYFEKIFSYLYNRLLLINTNFKIAPVDAIVSVPPRPNQYNRFTPYINALSDKYHIEDLSTDLICIKDYKSQKSLNQFERRDNIRGAFACSRDVRDRNIVVIDDIVTTGTTSLEIARTLYSAGANSVNFLIWGVNQMNNTNLCPSILCGNNDGSLSLKINGGNASLFWGCNNYPDCRYTLDYGLGQNKFLQSVRRNLDESIIEF